MKTIETNSKLLDFYSRFGSTDGLFYTGHASVLVCLNGYRILFDPIVLSAPYGDSWVFYPPQVLDPSLFDVDAVVVSHIHQDHYDVDYLKSLAGRAKIIVLGGRPSFEADLIANQVGNLHVIEPEVVTEILDGVFMFGLLHETNGVDSSAILYNDNFCIYHGNDNYISQASVEKFVGVGPKIDVACIPYAYIHWYPFLLIDRDQDETAKRIEGDRLIQHYMDDCIGVTRIMKPQLVIPFGANLILDDGDAYSDINAAVKTPIEFCEYVASVAPDLSSVIKPLLAGDFCGLVNGVLETNIHSDSGGEVYRAEANAFLKGRPSKKPDERWRPIDRAAFLAGVQEKLDSMEERPDHTIRIDLYYQEEDLKLEIDCRAAKATWVMDFSDKTPYHHFRLDPIASGEWLNGRRFEEIIGMRRFTLERVPNVYSPDILRLVGTVF